MYASIRRGSICQRLQSRPIADTFSPLQLGILCLRFEIWGSGVGLPSGSYDDEEVIPYNTNLDKPRVRPVIFHALENIQHLLQDVADVDGKYGVTIVTSDEGRTTLRVFQIFQKRSDRLKKRMQKGQKEKSIPTVTRWAVHDGPKFKNIVQRFEGYNDNLQKETLGLWLYHKHLDELRIHAEFMSSEEDLGVLAGAILQ